MSLTSFLKIPEVKAIFAKEFPLPKVSLTGSMVAPPITSHYSLIGTAFDYLLRFYLERLNRNAVISSWIARQAVELTKDYPKLFRKAKNSLEQAEQLYSKYIKTGNTHDRGIFRAAILLAQLDPIYRAAHIDETIGIVDEADMEDLANLLRVVNPVLFKSDSECLLNPTFGEGSNLVGGADADLIVDGKLIDIKTTVKLEFGRDHYNQLVGYYILSKIGSIPSLPDNAKITDLGIYYSRYAILRTISTGNIDENPNLAKFIRWFSEAAASIFQRVK